MQKTNDLCNKAASNYNQNSTGSIKTDIDADRMLITDQAGKQRISRTNALGHLSDVWEITASDTSTVSVSFPNQPSITHGYLTSYTYDVLGNLKTVSQGSQTRTFTYSSLSRLLSATNPESGTINYSYDNNGNLTQKTDARPVTTTYAYDELNRIKTRSYSDGTPQVTYTYDNVANAKGFLTKVSSSVSENRYTAFDKMGRVTASEQRTPFSGGETIATATPRTSSYKYNLAGVLIEQTYPSTRVVKNVLDTNGDLLLVQSKKNSNAGFWNYAQHYTYTASGAVSSMQFGNGTWESTTFNSRLQPTQIALGTVQNGVDKLKLNFDYGSTANNDNVLSQTITVPTVGTNPGFQAVQTYNYDSLNRLKQVDEKPQNYTQAQCDQEPTKCWKQTFIYDRYGNRTFDEGSVNGSFLTTTLIRNCATSSYNPYGICNKKIVNPLISAVSNRIVQDQENDQVNDYLFDSAGSMTKDAEGKIFTYDGENKQLRIEANSSVIGEYWYDGEGNRIKKKDLIEGQLEETIFVYDAFGRIVAEYSNQVATASNSKVSYLTSDHLGSSRITTDKDGGVISRRDFMPFGEEISTTAQRTARTDYAGDKVRQKFTEYERDKESEFDYAKARYYASRWGRFTTPDMPFFGQDFGDPQTINLYIYTSNNPLNRVDPDGHRWFHRIVEKNGELVRELIWVNPNEDGSYTPPEGVGWEAFVPTENQRYFAVQVEGGRAVVHLGENADGSPYISGLLWKGTTNDSSEDIIAVTPLGRTTVSVIRGIFGRAVLKWLGVQTTKKVLALTSNEIGAIGEKALAEFLKQQGGKKAFETSIGRRIVDFLAEGVANESKTGKARLTKFVKQQILKDLELLKTGQVKAVVWHFFKSPKTGKIGPTAPLKKALEDAGISIIIHK